MNTSVLNLVRDLALPEPVQKLVKNVDLLFNAKPGSLRKSPSGLHNVFNVAPVMTNRIGNIQNGNWKVANGTRPRIQSYVNRNGLNGFTRF